MTATPFMPRTKKIEIDDVNYSIQEMLASVRNMFLFRTNELLGKSIEALMSGYAGDKDIFVAAGEIVNGLSKNASPQELNEFIKDTILACVQSPKAACVAEEYELHFTQYYEHLPKLLKEIYEQNFGSAIEELKKKLFSLEILAPLFSSESLPEKGNPLSKEPAKVSLTTNFSNGTSS